MKLKQMPQILKIGDQTFKHIKTRIYSPIAVYSSKNLFLRIGPKAELEKEAQFHRKLLSFNFPIPKIVADGERDGQYYYIETSLGDTHFGDIFIQDVKQNGAISEKNFSLFLELSKSYAEAQLKTVTEDSWRGDFYNLIHVDYILKELPDIRDKSLQAYEKAVAEFSSFPSVLTHGDFNPHNLFEKGIIDLEGLSHAPAGYDLITGIFHFYMFPTQGNYELIRGYQFAKEQINQYLNEMDSIFKNNNLPSPSSRKNDFLFCRAIWATVRMEWGPRIQQWRYNLYRKILDVYLQNEDITKMLASHK